jgi:GDPmannose 4,6-dehydratase
MNYWRLEEMGLVKDGEAVPNLELKTMDVTCSTSVRETVEEGEFHEVYNLAAISFVHESFNSPAAVLQTNMTGVLNVLEALATTETRLYQASTSEMFGLVNVEAQDEQTPFHPRSPYGVAKAAAHYLVQNYREAYNLHASSGILFNHESPYRGIEFVTRKITDGVARIVAGKADKITLGNTDAKRDWGHAQDYVMAMWLMLQQDEPDDYVIATGESHSVRDFVQAAFKHAGIDDYAPYIWQDERYMRPSDVPILCGNPAKAVSKLGWQRTCTFETLVGEMVNYDLHRHGYDPIEAAARGEKVC